MAQPTRRAVPFREWADKWFAARVVRATTQAGDFGRYRTHLLPAFGDVELKDLTPLRIKTFVAELSTRRKPATVRHVHALLSTILNDAVAEGLLLTNPCRFSRLPRAPRYEAVYLSPAEVECLVDAIDPTYRDLVIVAAGTGMRWGELAGLKRQRVDLLRRRLEVAETLVDVDGHLSFGELKTCWLPPLHLAAQAGDRRALASPRRIDRRTRVHVARGRPATPPQLLRAHLAPRRGRGRPRPEAALPRPASHARRDAHLVRRPDEAIQDRLGHSSIVMTMDRYGHLLADVDDALLAVLDQRLPV